MVVGSAPPLPLYLLRKGSHPIHYAWNRADESAHGHCFNVDAFFIGSGSINVALNFLIFVLVCRHSPREEMISNTRAADPNIVASAYDSQATNCFDSSLHLSWLVRLV